MINVCDAIMGSGKTNAAITFINSNNDRRYIYIATYLDEAKRIVNSCPSLNFIEPAKYTASSGISKIAHIRELLEQGKNISSTQQAIPYYTDDMFDMIRDKNYTVIIDEVVNVFDDVNKPASTTSGSTQRYNYEVSVSDVDLLVTGGYLVEAHPGEFHCTGKDFSGLLYEKVLTKIKTCPLTQINDNDPSDSKGWKWLFPKRLFESAEEIFILTYMFDGSEMAEFFRINGFEYTVIGVSHPDARLYHFSDQSEYIPDYVNRLPDMVHICNNKKMNAIGEKRTSLSMHWYDTRGADDPDIKKLKDNLTNYYTHILSDIPNSQRMTGVYERAWPLVKTKGCGKKSINFVPFNQKAKNDWNNYTALAYTANVFLSPMVKNYFFNRGGCIDEEKYALSTMIQWIWRSAIRNGNEVYIYIPSKRMRCLLTEWISRISNVRG